MEIRVNFFCAKYCLRAIEDKLCMFMKRILFDVIGRFAVQLPEGDEKGCDVPLLCPRNELFSCRFLVLL